MIIRLILVWSLKSMQARHRLTVGREDLICDRIQVHITGIGQLFYLVDFSAKAYTVYSNETCKHRICKGEEYA